MGEKLGHFKRPHTTLYKEAEQLSRATGTAKLGRRPRVNREELFDAISHVVAERGYESTRFSDVSEVAGVSVGSLQWAFKSREQMVVETLENRALSYLTDLQAGAARVSDPIARLRWVAGHLAPGVGDSESARIEWLVWTEYWRAALRDDSLRSSSIHMYEGWIGLVQEGIQACVDAGVARTTLDVRDIATSIVAMGDGLGIQGALSETTMSWPKSGELLQMWLAKMLDCPELTEGH